MGNDGEQRPQGPPDYKVYRARRGFFSRLRKPDLSGLREREWKAPKLPGRPGGPKRERGPRAPRPALRRALKWIGIAALGWILLSFLAFAVSAQLQSFKLSGEAKSKLHGNPFLLPSAQTILVLGTDARPPDTKEPGAAPSQECFEQQSHGDSPHGHCSQGEFRADTLMLIRAGGGAFRKLSIPRDSYAEIPGQSPQKINAAYAFGGAAAQIEAVEDFLGVEVDHVAIVDFTGFEDLIDAVGGVKVDVPHKLCANISGGAGGGQGGFTLRLGKGENTLDGEKALIYSRIREPSECPGAGQERLLARLQRLRPREGPAGRDRRHQGPPHRPAAAPLQLHPRPDHRLGRAEGLRQRHGLLHDAAADPLSGDQRRKQGGCALLRAPTRAARKGRAGRSKCLTASGGGLSRN